MRKGKSASKTASATITISDRAISLAAKTSGNPTATIDYPTTGAKA